MAKNRLLLAIFLGSSLFTIPVHAAQPAKKKKATLQDLLKKASGETSSPTTVAGVRGLDEVNGEVDTKARDFKSIEQLEGLIIHDEDVQKFADEGNLK